MDESVVRHLEQQQVGTLKLSEAIRIGALIRPKCIGAFFDGEGSCAWGAAYEGAGGVMKPGQQIYMEDITRLFKQFTFTDTLRRKIADLNDVEGWSRGRIADWLEGQGY